MAPAKTLEDIRREQEEIAENLRVVMQHMEMEGEDFDAVLELYTDDVVWETPSRGQVLRTYDEIREAYRQMGASMFIRSRTLLRRFATDHWVVDESLWHVTLIDDKIPNLSYPVGTELSLRKLTLFEMRDGKICREINHTSYRPAGDPRLDHDDIPAEAFTAVAVAAPEPASA
ncbi:nuclear transport factor 2 family protein [Streptomyces sp. NPDC048483]|uniref:nuclear transport factor 2 family protein n=1 Tax=Streptomyces sp. NPDC048483 TaxID=3154927 RepID=UPI00342B015F